MNDFVDENHRYQFQPQIRPQTEVERINDLRSWRNLGKPDAERHPMLREPVLRAYPSTTGERSDGKEG